MNKVLDREINHKHTGELGFRGTQFHVLALITETCCLGAVAQFYT